MKKCPKCKLVAEFGKHKNRPDGLQVHCKKCRKAEAVVYYQEHRIEISAYHKTYYQTPTGKAAQRRGNENKRRRFPEKEAAKCAINNAIYRGKLVRSVFCEGCGLPAKTEGHHPDYIKPLEVQWLCRKCHRGLHKNGRLLCCM